MKFLVNLMFPFFALSSPVGQETEQISSEVPRLSPVLSSSLAKFSTELYQLVEKKEVHKNVVIAPFSIHMAMSLLYEGAVGDSKRELGAALKIQHAREADILQESKSLMTYYKFNSNPSNQIEFANVLFVDKDTAIKDNYISTLTENYLSAVETIDYSKPVESANTINSWVSNKTNNLITKFVNPGSINSGTRLMLINAIYFKAKWLHPFFNTQTKKMTFNVAQNLSVEAEMMFQENDFLHKYDNNLRSQVISMLYENQNMTMMIILPDEDIAIESVNAWLRTQDFNELHKKLSLKTIHFKMPKFDINFKTSLVQDFGDLGVQALFNDELANLSNISDEPLVVSNVLHEAIVKVDEEGSEAAAVTGIELDLRTSDSFTLPITVNRPFIFVIQDIRNNIPLFIGKVVNPTDQKPRVKIIEDKEENLLGIRNSPDLNELVPLNLDPEERVHLENYPKGYEQPKLCKEVRDYSGTEPNQIIFPCNETAPIVEYKNVHGDPSRLGINGEKAALAYDEELDA
eukprot:GFUD01035958.1.p1 GENE.GFUD01035958.1~~GFUD01035958.1.p1  ORF type:complete len:517 (+),score=130.80 GFUD01035958.1:101-1651(+)